MMSLRLENRVAIVTGGTGALGRATVRRLLSAGAAVHATWVEKKELGPFKDYLGDAAAKVRLHELDATHEKRTRAVYAEIAEQHGRLDILANLVGGFSAAPLGDTGIQRWESMLAINATSTFVSSRAAVPFMRPHRAGRIINVASAPALNRGGVGMSAYAASKAAVLNLTYSLADELAPFSITVNAIVPSILDTAANRASMTGADTSTWLKPDEVAEVIGFLASDAGSVVTGTAVRLEKGTREAEAQADDEQETMESG